MRKVFIVTGGGSLGGHNRTALISALEMIRRGYEVHIVTGGEITIYQNYDIILLDQSRIVDKIIKITTRSRI